MPSMSVHFSDGLLDRRRRRRIGDIVVTIACLAWIALSGWAFFGDVPDEITDNHTSKAMQDRMKACEGSFQKRYECKQRLLLDGERWGFAVAVNRIMLICAPPITAWIVWSAIKRRGE
ncbi:hypothetical protein A6A04_00615 [Paramagnetospirillum marisnigri]|uniref:Transmembrane protein n=1 Tax=Paramagnetospirillum marisnigri TaxID=1285242 RepID=A0A178MUC2_9PROT|nr:hypothetical protein [Paramagnetospirillum marisnigri]OAN52233.1 hypothetical protein A6A04_00615 [Paramagnetospirillum marisnigri]